MLNLYLVLPNDNANGRFSFAEPCQPSRLLENQTFTCYLQRTLGNEGHVTVHWSANSIENEEPDFEPAFGEVYFSSGESEKVKIIVDILLNFYSSFLYRVSI